MTYSLNSFAHQCDPVPRSLNRSTDVPKTPNIKALLRQRLAESLPDATPAQIDELMTMAIKAGAAINQSEATSEPPTGPVHYLT